MKPAWDQLGDEFINSKTVLIGDVDCTVEDVLCAKYGVTGYPTIKYFTSETAEDGDVYEGPRDFNGLLAFADDNLGPTCSPATMEVCDEEQKATLKKYMGMTVAERKEIVDDAEKAVADLEEKFKSDVAELQATYGRLQKDKDNILKSVNTKELQLLKTIR